MNSVSIKGTMILAVLGILFIFLQYALWGGKQNVVDLYRTNQQVDDVRNENLQFRNRNDQLHEDVIAIKNRLGAIESQARFDLGLIKPGETYYQIFRSDQD